MLGGEEPSSMAFSSMVFFVSLLQVGASGEGQMRPGSEGPQGLVPRGR